MMSEINKLIRNQKIIALCVVLLTLLIFVHTRVKGASPHNQYIRLSEQLLQGHIEIKNPPAYLEMDYVPRTGKYFVVYPPMPSIVLIPAVLFNIADKDQTAYSIFFGALNAGLLYLLTLRFFSSRRIATILTTAFVFGTSFWYLATDGSSWYISHMFALFFLFLTFFTLEIKKINKKITAAPHSLSWLLAGLSLGAAYFSRDPTILAALFFLSIPFIWGENYKKQLMTKAAPFVAGLTVFILLAFGYNFARFGTIRPVQHEYIPHMLENPIFSKGFLNIAYIPRNVQFFFFKLPLPYASFPYFKPALEGMSYFIVSPFFMLLLFAKWRERWVQLAFLTGVVMLIPPFMNGSNGFTQFGYRYAMEATPFFLLSFGSFLERKRWWLSVPFIIAAILVNIWAIYFVRFLDIYGF